MGKGRSHTSSYSDKTQSNKTRHQNGGRKQSWWLELRGVGPGTEAKQKEPNSCLKSQQKN